MNVSFCVAAFAWRPGTFLISHAKQMTLERWRKKEIRSDAAYLSVLHRIFCLSFCPRPRYNLCCSFLEKVDAHAYTHAYTHTYTHTYIHTYIHIHIHIPLCHTQLFHHFLCLSFLPRPCYNLWCSLLEEVDLWGFPVL